MNYSPEFKYKLILNITLGLNFIDLVLTALFVHFHGISLESNLLARYIHVQLGLVGLICFKVFIVYLYIMIMNFAGYSKRTNCISLIIMFLYLYATYQHCVVLYLLKGYSELPIYL